MAIFLVYAITFILFEDYDRGALSAEPMTERSDWHLLVFTLVVMLGLGWVLHRYARSMDQRISKEQAAKENQVRRQLTNNISHELKTPVSSILGYAETIMDHPEMDDETRNLFVDRTYRQAKRLTVLLQDISTLNRIDYAPDQLVKERVDVSQMVRDILHETALTLSQRKVTVSNCLPGDVCVVGNFSLLYSIFRNLIDNAAVYAGEGATAELTAQERGDSWFFSFCDNGPGIAEEHISHLFERFYRVDKGRSRQLGGTGLGLAIVKNAVLLHGGTITAKNVTPHGLCFEFSLKK